ncbi:DUF3857 domain-containing protein [Sunxiuqinia sp. A32]|uniref:DUF3857 domain-containing protein n=1 Tax=Sunxiuqinia sp. A32 TaxID=3461496 RepID=UPI00404565E7
MKIKFTQLIYLFLFVGIIQSSFAQKSPVKFGKISAEDFEDEYCPIDSNAHAYFIFDSGWSRFEYANKTVDTRYAGSNKGFQLLFNRHFRIKIIDDQAFDWGNIEIPLYHAGKGKEEVTRIRALTYNLENGKVIKTKIEKDAVNTEESSKYWDIEKLAMPNVKNGSIIEVEYTIKSDFYFNLREWFFQHSIPSLSSQYVVEIPEYFKYNVSQTGYYQIVAEQKSRNRKLELTFKEGDTGGQKYNQTFDYKENVYIFDGTNIPAFPEEKFLKTEKNYLTKVDFELQSTQFNHGKVNYYTTTWEEIDEDLMDEESFGKALTHLNYLKDDVEKLRNQEVEGLELVSMAFNHIKKQISWNGIYNKYVKTSLSKAYKDKTGNCSEVNLNLVGLLRELGFSSNPVILSTRKNGIIVPTHPSISRFNYVIAMIALDGNTYLLDATDPDSEINLLPIRCLNDKGRIIGTTGEKWINLMDYMTYEASSNYSLTIGEDLSVTGKASLKLDEYAAYQERKEFGESNTIQEYEKNKNEEKKDWSIKNLKLDGIDSSKELIMSYEFDIDNQVNNTNEMAYFSPMVDPFFNENPFKLETREFPVEFSYPYKIQQIYTISLPENYEVSELPETLVATLPNNDGKFMYQVKKFGNGLHVSSVFMLNKSQFLPSEYDFLKQFFQLVIDKQNEFVVLKSI